MATAATQGAVTIAEQQFVRAVFGRRDGRGPQTLSRLVAVHQVRPCRVLVPSVEGARP
eukprot:SAG25_NODE_430_length_8134_cov_59.362290_7_plen_58_part_00